MDGRQIEVPDSAPVLRVPLPIAPPRSLAFDASLTPTPVPVARYVRCDHVDGRISYRYQGQEQL